MTKLRESQNFVLENRIYWPSFLFFKKQQDKTVSPASRFDPAGALEDSGFKSSISPSQSFIKKKIIIDKDSLSFLAEEGEKIAFLKRLQVAGFTIFFRGEKNGAAVFHKLKEDFSNIDKLRNISPFQLESDLKILEIARDERVILDSRQAGEIEKAFCHNKHDATEGNDWDIGFSNDLIGGVIPKLPSIQDPQYLQKMAFVLNRAMSSYTRQEIMKKFAENLRNFSGWKSDCEGLLTLRLIQPNLQEYTSESLETLVFRNLSSNKQFFAALEVFPHRHSALQDYLNNLSQLDVVSNFGKYPELLEKFPDQKERLLNHIIHESEKDPTSYSSQVAAILTAILQRKEKEALQKFDDFSQQEIALPCRINGLFARAAHNNFESDFFYEQLEQKLSEAINPSALKITQDELDEIILDLNPENIVKISRLILKTNQDFLSEKLVIAAFRANPQMAQELVKAYCARNVDIASKKRVICSLPNRLLQNFLHGQVINSSDQFLLLEDWIGLKKTSSSSYQDPKHTTYIQSYDTSGYALGDCKEWLRGLISEEILPENIVAVKITNRGKDIDVDEVKSFITLALSKGIKHFTFAADLARNERFKQECLTLLTEEGASHEVVDYDDYWEIGNAIKESARQAKSQIRIAFNSLANQIGVDNSQKSNYAMGVAGEILNDTSENLQIRTAIIANDITNNLDQSEYVPQNFREVSSANILDQEIAELRATASDQHIFCQFRQALKANRKCRLLSVNPKEDFYGILGNQSVRIFRGDDDFFYAESTRDCELDYVIKAPNPKLISGDAYLSGEDPIKKIIDEYRDHNKGFTPTALKEKLDVKYDPHDHAGSMERMFNERLGSCRHRAAAVLYKIKSSLPQSEQDRCRMVRIDNNHVVLEVKSSEGEWVRADLGGSENYTSTNLADNEVYKATEHVALKQKQKQPQTKPTHLKLETLQDQSYEPEVTTAQLMFNALNELTKFPRVTSEEELAEEMANKEKFLVVAANIDDNAEFILSKAREEERKVFYIDDPKKAGLHKLNLQIEEGGTPLLFEDTPLFQFLQSAKFSQKPLLMINWDAFDSKQRVAMNTLLDPQRMISGMKIDEAIQVVGLSSQYPTDASFIHRHDGCVVSEICHKKKEEKETARQIIDLEGFSNWRSKLFGKLTLVGEEIRWEKSDFVEAIERGEKKFQIINLSPEHAQELQHEFQLAQANGRFDYYGYHIPLSADIDMKSQGDNAFDFQKFNEGSPARIKKYSDMPADATLVNNHLFDLLLTDKVIENGLYYETEGLIEKTAKSPDKPLRLFISSQLSENQWYCLFNEAQKHGVELELYLNRGVEIPSQIKTEKIGEGKLKTKKSTARIILDSNPEKVLKSLPQDYYAVIDVEDFSYQDLVERIDFETTKSGFQNFRHTESKIIEQLKEGKKIVLKGTFSQGLLNSLSPLLFSDLGTNLTLIAQEDANSANLEWLQPEMGRFLFVEKFEEDEEDEPKFTKIRLEKFEASSTLENSKEEAERFIAERKDSFLADLQENSMLRLVGHSGVGKSSLIREFEKSDSDVKIYRELNNFDEWASDKTDDRMKVLFIDESNMEDLHLTLFSPLKRGGKQRIFYNQKFYELDENHKVVFACNPVQYGSGRFEQKLFDDGVIPAVELRDFPPSYIYEKILKETIYEKLSPQIREKFPEEKFKELCVSELDEYRRINSAKSGEQGNEMTVRELQEKVLTSIETSISTSPQPQINESDFVSTNATKSVEESLAHSLRIRKKQYEGEFPQEACGLNGVLLNGDSGTGKSVLIKSVLKSEGLRELRYTPKARLQGQRGYYKIDASLPLEKKREIIVRAFEEGNVVWLDELNSCIDDGLEKVLNSVLTGEHPDGKKAAKKGKAGFMLISSINSASELEGRTIISPALRHRMSWHDVPSLRHYDDASFTKIVECWSRNNPAVKRAESEIAQDFTDCIHSRADTGFNLRMLKMVLPDLVQNYLDEPQPQRTFRASVTKTKPLASTTQNHVFTFS